LEVAVPDARSKRVSVVCHCHLDVNTKVHGLADHAGTDEVLITRLVFEGSGIVQLPCPEATYLGMRRWSMTSEQYDTAAYRRHCRDLLRPVVDTLVALAVDDCRVEAVYGVDGSPSCGVSETSTGFCGGDIAALAAAGKLPGSTRSPGRGVYLQEFEAMLADAGIEAPFSSPKG
jgi:predicted secreted protein